MIPKESEVVEYAEKILKFMIRLETVPRVREHGGIGNGYSEREIRKMQEDLKKVSSYYPIAIDFLVLREEEPNFKDALEYALKNTKLSGKEPRQ